MVSLNFAQYAPKERLLLSEWAEQNVMIPEGNERPGKLSLREAPFQKGCWTPVADPTINRITFMTGAQVGKTLVALCMIGFFTAS